MRPLAVLVLLAGPVVAAPVPKGDPPPAAFRDGETKVYAVTTRTPGRPDAGSELTFTTTHVRVTPVGDLYRTDVTRSEDGRAAVKLLPVFTLVVGGRAVQADADGKRLPGADGDGIDPAYGRIKPGESRRVRLARRDGTADTVIAAEAEETLAVPAGTFKAVRLAVTSAEPDGTTRKQGKVWYQTGTATMLKNEATNGDRTTVMVLKFVTLRK
jgi:hypothetical protein